MEFEEELYDYFKGIRDRILRYLAPPPLTDLSEETVEELRMVTGMSVREIASYRTMFLDHVTASKDEMLLTEFMQVPSIQANPLKDRLAICFGFEGDQVSKYMQRDPSTTPDIEQPAEAQEGQGSAESKQASPPGSGEPSDNKDQWQAISFETFLVAMQRVRGEQREQKLRFAFQIQDFDGDGRLNKKDLVSYFSRIFEPVESNHEHIQGEAELQEDPEGQEEGKEDVAKSPETDIDEEKGNGGVADKLQIPQLSFEEQMGSLADKILAEMGAEADGGSIGFDDFQRVVAPTDFGSKLQLPFS